MHWIMAVDVLGGFQNLAWAQRISYGLFIYAVYINAWASRERSVDRPWRRLYAFKSIISFVALIYYTMLITEVITTESYIDLARWLQPLIIICLFTSAKLHKWEVGTLRQRKELDDKVRRLTAKD